MDCVYLDNNATTPLHPAVREAMLPFFDGVQGNPASAHQLGRRARQALDDARERIASLLDAYVDEVVFTSGATESNNLALLSLAADPPGHLLSSPVEHPSVSESLAYLSQQRFTLTMLPVDEQGIVVLDGLEALRQADTRLVAVMLANHETGAVQPVAEIVQGLAVPTHCDAVQAVGKIPVRFRALGVTTLSFSAHKFHGPRGIGGLIVRRGVRLRPQLRGGHQQQGRRPGTEPVALAVGMAVALELASKEQVQRTQHVAQLRKYFLERLRDEAGPMVLNGPVEGGMPHTINLSFHGLPGDGLLMALDLAGVACSTGSACSSGSLRPSPVLQAMQVGEDRLRSAIRFSLSALTTQKEVEEGCRRICRVVKRLRQGAIPDRERMTL